MAMLPKTRVNGAIPSWSSLEFGIQNFQLVHSVRDINYKMKLNKQNVYGAGRVPIGQTLGTLEFEGDITFALEDAMGIRRAIGNGWGDVLFPITVKTRLTPTSIICVDVIQCSISEIDKAYKQGMDPLADKFTLLPLKMSLDGSTAPDPIVGYSQAT